MRNLFVAIVAIVALLIGVGLGVALAIGVWIRRDDARADASRRRPGGGAE